MAAGVLLVQEAGGRVTEPDGAAARQWSGRVVSSSLSERGVACYTMPI
jgi:fructose-1,6-bisphosphatase/inositol monophosphatase family enzyme